MPHGRNNSERVVARDWHRFRRIARETAFDPTQFSDIEREEYNLDDDDELSARITGEHNDETYIGDDTSVEPLGGTDEERDLRNVPGRA